MTEKPETIFGQIDGNFSFRHRVELRVQLCAPRQGTFPNPLTFVDVTRTTHANVGVLQEGVWLMTGMLLWIACQIHGQDSRSSHCCVKKTFKKDICGPGGG